MMCLLRCLCMLIFVTGSLRAAGTHWFQLAWMAAESHGSFLLVSVLGLEVCPTVPCSLCGARIWNQAFWLSQEALYHWATPSAPCVSHVNTLPLSHNLCSLCEPCKHSTTEPHPLLLFGFELESCYVAQVGHRLMIILLLQLHECLDHRPALPRPDVDRCRVLHFLSVYLVSGENFMDFWRATLS